MKTLLALTLVLIWGLSFSLVGCLADKREPDKPPREVLEAESKDSTALDSAVAESVPLDSVVHPPDSM